MRQQELLTASEAGRRLDPPLSPSAIRLAADSGRLKIAAVTPTGLRLFHPDDVEAFRVSRLKTARAKTGKVA